MVGVKSEFIEGCEEALDVASTLNSEGYSHLSRDLRIAIVKMLNGYHERLVRSINRIESEKTVLDHAKKHIPKSKYPGDMRAEGEVVE